LIKSLNL